MATVINFNILNFFKLNRNDYTINNIRLNSSDSPRKKDTIFAADTVIDVTPVKTAVTDDRCINRIYNSSYSNRLHDSQRYSNVLSRFSTYDRNGKEVTLVLPKGLHVDEYA